MKTFGLIKIIWISGLRTNNKLYYDYYKIIIIVCWKQVITRDIENYIKYHN